MKEQMQIPRNQDGEPPTHGPKETAQRLEQKADEQQGESNRARTGDKAREAREGNNAPEKSNDGKKRREVHFGG